jgi:hypothetical protein
MLPTRFESTAQVTDHIAITDARWRRRLVVVALSASAVLVAVPVFRFFFA